jgi:tetratricopeptide (TPR) repeat protein
MTSGGVRRLFVEERDGGAVPRRLPVLAAAGGCLVVGGIWSAVAPACVAGAGALFTVAVARDDRFLLRAALLAFSLRALLAVVLQWAAGLDLAALAPLQLGPVGGYRFWVLASDSAWYHKAALRLLAAWQDGTGFRRPTEFTYIVLAGSSYFVFGPNPLNAVLWNALFGSLTVVAGYRIAARLAGPSAARPAAILIALWPSAVLWSSVLLKDALCLWLTLLLLYLAMRATDPPLPAPSRWGALARRAGLLLALFAAAVTMHQFRTWVLMILAPMPVVFILDALVRRGRRTPWRLLAPCIVMGVMLLAVVASRHIDPYRLLTPPHPEIRHVALGVMYQSRGDLDAAREQYERALLVVKNYPPALRNLASVAIARNARPEAIAYLERYLVGAPGDDRARAVLEALRRPPPATPLPALDPVRGPARPVPDPGRWVETGSAWRYDAVISLLRIVRRGFDTTPGHSTLEPKADFRGYGDVLGYLLRAISHTLLAPYPWQWFDSRGATGPFKRLSAMEALLLYAVLLPSIVGLGIAIGRRSPDALFLAGFVAAMTVLLGLAVSNLGTLFRLRLESLLPLFAAGGPGWTWLRATIRWTR